MFSTATAATTSTAVWAQLPQLPLECYEPEILSQIGHILGKPLRVDAHTVGKMSDGKPEQVGKARGGFARICVQVDLNKPLVQKFMISNHIQHVLYENISALCFSCGCIGHRADECKKHTCQSEGPGTPTTTPFAGKEINASTTDSINAVPLIKPTNKDPPMDGYGPWNLVKKKANRHRQQKPEANNRAKSPIPSKSPRKRNGSDTGVGSFNPGQKSSTPPMVKSEQSVGGPPKKSPLAPTDKKLIALPPSAHLPDAHDALTLNLKGKGTLLPPPPVHHEGHSCQAQPSRFQALGSQVEKPIPMDADAGTNLSLEMGRPNLKPLEASPNFQSTTRGPAPVLSITSTHPEVVHEKSRRVFSKRSSDTNLKTKGPYSRGLPSTSGMILSPPVISMTNPFSPLSLHVPAEANDAQDTTLSVQNSSVSGGHHIRQLLKELRAKGLHDTPSLSSDETKPEGKLPREVTPTVTQMELDPNSSPAGAPLPPDSSQ